MRGYQFSLPQAAAISAWLEKQHFENALTAWAWLVVVYGIGCYYHWAGIVVPASSKA